MPAAEHPATGQPVALVTGGAQRIGAAIARALHAAGYRVLVHYRDSADAATALVQELNALRSESAHRLCANLDSTAAVQALANQAGQAWGRLDLLVNNASAFHPTPIGSVNEAQWDSLFASNLKAPFFLSQALAPLLAHSQGSIVNLVDIHAQKPLAQHTVYCVAKAGLVMLTQSLALELAPAVRVNGIAPGAILWPPGQHPDAGEVAQRVAGIPLRRKGEPEDIANTVLFLARSPYITGQVIAVDGGRSLAR